MLRAVTDSAAKKSIMQMPKLDGFQIWRFFTRRTYFEVMAITEHSAYGQNAGERSRIPTLMPVMYALARCGHLPVIVRPRISSATMLEPMASRVLVQLSRMPNEKCPISRIAVMKIGGIKRFCIVKKRLAHESRAAEAGGLMAVGVLMRVPSL